MKCDDEKAFVDAVLEESENLYGKTLAEKQNELRRVILEHNSVFFHLKDISARKYDSQLGIQNRISGEKSCSPLKNRGCPASCLRYTYHDRFLQARTQVSRLQGDYSILNLAGFASSEPDILRQGSLSLKEDERHDVRFHLNNDDAGICGDTCKPNTNH